MKPTSHDVVITGLGPVTSIGVGCADLWTGLSAGRRNVEQRTLTVDLGKCIELPIAGMSHDDSHFDRHNAYLAEQNCEGSRDLAYSLSAIELALADARFEFDRADNKIGMIQAYEAPGVERTATKLFQLFSTPPTGGPPPVYDLLAPAFYNMQAFLYVHVVAKAFGLRGFCTSVHNACSSGAFAMETAAQQIRSGQSDVMIVVGGECFETAVRLEWFRRLNLYAQNADSMRPFNADTTGFYVGEGAAAMVLESAESAAKRGATPYARYLGGAFAHQAWKQTIPDVRAARLKDVILDDCKKTGVNSSAIDLIVPHGAATQLSDGYEAACLNAALSLSDPNPERQRADGPSAAFFKPAVGHMLAASAIIDTLCALLVLKHQSIPAACRPAPDHSLHAASLSSTTASRSSTTVSSTKFKTLLKTSTGFTGHDAALLFEAW
jgi:3-oxoacyl-(acyl-carrier-protein) synthase